MSSTKLHSVPISRSPPPPPPQLYPEFTLHSAPRMCQLQIISSRGQPMTHFGQNEIRERKHPTDPFHPVQRLFPFNGGSPLPLCQPHLSCLAKSYISQSADPEKWCEVVAVSCRFLHSRRRRKTVMARDFPNGSASKPNLSCCCVARRSFFFLCDCVNWPLWLSHDGFLPTWV